MNKIFSYIRENPTPFCLLAVLLFSLVTFLVPILYYGLPDGFDLYTDIRFAAVYRESMLNGNLFPGWANDNFGFGSIGVRFYPPIAFITLALAHSLTHEWFISIILNLVFWMCLGCVGMFLLVKE